MPDQKHFSWSVLAIIFLGAIVFPMYYLIVGMRIAGAPGYPLDDAWIHLVFARNIARGDWFSYNPHHHVAGTTSPMWSALLGIGYAISGSDIVMPVAIGILLTFFIGVLAWRLAVFFGLKNFPAVMTSLLVSGATRIVVGSVSGMEVSLYTALALASIFLYLSHRTDARLRGLACWCVAALAAAARPELLLLPIFFLLHQCLLRLQVWRNRNAQNANRAHIDFGILSFTTLAKGSIVFLLTILPVFALNYFLSGHLFPLTYSVKASNDGAEGLVRSGAIAKVAMRFVNGLWFANVNMVKWMWVQDNLFLALVCIIAIVWMIVMVIRGCITKTNSSLLFLAIVLMCFAPIRSVVTGIADFGPFGRVASQLTPVMIIFSCVLLSRWIIARAFGLRAALYLLCGGALVATVLLFLYYRLLPVIGRTHRLPSLDWYLPVLNQGADEYVWRFAVLAAMIGVIGIVLLQKKISASLLTGLLLAQCYALTIVENLQTGVEYGWNVRNINDTQVAISHWLTENLPLGGVYATCDIGAMAYFAEGRTVVDLLGLVTPEITHQFTAGRSFDQTSIWALERFHPAFVVTYDYLFPDLIRFGTETGALEKVHTVEIPNNMTCGYPGVTEMQIYKVHEDHVNALLQREQQALTP